MKTKITLLLFSALFLIVTACGSDVDERFVKRWTLTKVVGFGPEKDEILGINNVFFDLRDDETFDARWYKDSTDYEDLSGKWLTTKYGDKVDLFLFYGPGQKKSKIFTITKVDDKLMVMNLSNIDHVFTAK
ncbi:MAG: hypothetical protein K0R65_1557 [Crocinitomicaceae bacterium]|jgi:hypothetical protein|nr:hypothetical protein [Crocinitomicaceae bacterium]